MSGPPQVACAGRMAESICYGTPDLFDFLLPKPKLRRQYVGHLLRILN
jgi:hypothetical protein